MERVITLAGGTRISENQRLFEILLYILVTIFSYKVNRY